MSGSWAPERTSVLSFIDGEVLSDLAWQPGRPTGWPAGPNRRRPSPGRHVGPHNTVYRHGMPVAFIDWDGIRPNHPLVEFGEAAWRFVPLGSEAYFHESGFPARPDLASRLARFAREYGLTDRAGVRWALHQAKQRSVEAAHYWPTSPAEGATALRLLATELEWLQVNLDELVSKIG